MFVTLPVLGVCPAGTVNVYRVFSNRADANHRCDRPPRFGRTWSRPAGSPRATARIWS